MVEHLSVSVGSFDHSAEHSVRVTTIHCKYLIQFRLADKILTSMCQHEIFFSNDCKTILGKIERTKCLR